MGSVRKRGKRWQATVRRVGHPELNSAHDTKAEANAWIVDVERKIKAGQPVAGRSARIVRDVWDKYPEKRAGVSKWDRLRLAAYSRDPIAQKQLHLVGPADFAALRDRRLQQVAESTVRREWGLLHATFKLAIAEWGWLELHPMRGIAWPKGGQARRRRVSDAEILLLRVATGYRPDAPPDTIIARCGAAFELAIETMMRGTEILNITRADLHLARRFVHLPKTKNGDVRDVGLSARAKQIVEQVLELGFDPIFGVNESQKDANFRKAVARAGLVDLVFHDSRHEAATRLAQKLNILDLCLMGGWRDVNEVRETYYNPTGEEIADRLNA